MALPLLPSFLLLGFHTSQAVLISAILYKTIVSLRGRERERLHLKATERADVSLRLFFPLLLSICNKAMAFAYSPPPPLSPPPAHSILPLSSASPWAQKVEERERKETSALFPANQSKPLRMKGKRRRKNERVAKFFLPPSPHATSQPVHPLATVLANSLSLRLQREGKKVV